MQPSKPMTPTKTFKKLPIILTSILVIFSIIFYLPAIFLGADLIRNSSSNSEQFGQLFGGLLVLFVSSVMTVFALAVFIINAVFTKKFLASGGPLGLIIFLLVANGLLFLLPWILVVPVLSS